MFDWEGVDDQENETGDAPPIGIERVFVNGKQVLSEGRVSTVRGAGEVLTP